MERQKQCSSAAVFKKQVKKQTMMAKEQHEKKRYLK